MILFSSVKRFTFIKVSTLLEDHSFGAIQAGDEATLE